MKYKLGKADAHSFNYAAISINITFIVLHLLFPRINITRQLKAWHPLAGGQNCLRPLTQYQ